MNETNTFPDFSNKVVSFSSDDGALTLVNPQFEFQAGKLFVTGTIPKDGTNNNWAEGRSAAISWESISDYIIFDSQKQFSELLHLSAR